MGVSGQRHAPAARLPPGKGPPVPIVQEAGWAPELVWTQRLEEKSFAPFIWLPVFKWGVLIITFLYKKNHYVGSIGEKKELFNICLVEFQGVISCVAAFWVKSNTALCTYKSSFTFDVFPHAHSLTASCWVLLLMC
jgi:hypothetical protein